MKGYNIGLDIGVTSVGWAVTNNEGKLIRINGKKAMGTHLFDEAAKAQERRTFRATRRRLARRRWRIRLLQEQLASDIYKYDPKFYQRLAASKLLAEDSHDVKSSYNLFEDLNFTDKDYFNKDNYPTIYHLRLKLMNDTKQYDPRLIYLALHHCIKYRGHFIFEGQEFSVSDNQTTIDKLHYLLNDYLKLNLSDDLIIELINILKNKNYNRSTKQKEFVNKINNKEKKDQITNLSKAIVGLKGNFSKIFIETELKTSDDKAIEFELSKIDDKLDLVELINQDYAEQFEAILAINSWIVLQDILNNETSISKAMVNIYDNHANDLKVLKKLIRSNNDKAFYKELFKGDNCKYNVAIKKYEDEKEGYPKLYKTIKEKVVNYTESEEKNYILNKIEQDNLLPLINTKKNSKIPYQLHLKELEQIIENQSVYYPSLKENDLSKLLTFRIPYYVGPLKEVNQGSQFSWMKRKEAGVITPYNFEEKVDIDASAENFIQRMTNNCTYLISEKVMPKNSLLYKRYCVYNELNQIRVQDKKLSNKEKEAIYQLFLEKKSVKANDLCKHPILHEKYPNLVIGDIRGFSDENKFANNLSSEIDFIKIFGNNFDEEQVEKIIYYLTVFEDKKIVKRKLRNEFDLSDNQIKQIERLNYDGWSRLSEKLLTGIYDTNKRTGEVKTIMDYLKDTDQVFMQIINDEKYDFKEIINNESILVQDELNYEVIDALATSPANKRGIYRSILVIKEIIQAKGYPPTNIFIEMARSEEEKKRTRSRYDTLENNFKENNEKDMLKELEVYKNEKNKLDNEKLFLYFMQLGRCLYSNQPLDIDNLSNYQIDHIIPYSLKPDDSFENKALVLSDLNQKKGNTKVALDIVPDKAMIINVWRNLLDKKLISENKYRSLMRKQLSDKDIEGFLSRQLVETRQISKHVINLLSKYYEGTNVYAIRANLSSELRQKTELFKYRDLNDHHHAFDAFLAIQIGLFIKTKYPVLENDIKYNTYSKSKKSAKTSFIIKEFMTNTDEWDFDKQLRYLKQAYNLPEVLITKKLEENNGAFYDQTIKSNFKNSKNKKSLPTNSLGKNPISRDEYLNEEIYGGYSSNKQAYIIEIELKDKNSNITRQVRGISCLLAKLAEKDKNIIKKYLDNEFGEGNYRVTRKKIKKNQKIIVDGHPYRLTSYSEWVNDRQLYIPSEKIKFLNNPNNKNDEDLINLYKILSEKIGKYYKCYKNMDKNLISSINVFENLNYDDKKSIITKIISVTNTSKTNVNLEKVGCRKDQGRINNKSLDSTNWIYINESVTGLFNGKV